MRYHVFIDGSRDTTTAGVEILATTLGQRYGMSPPAVMRQLKEGRFCARASLELPAAQRLVVELESLGAHASLVGDGAPTPLGPRYESGLAAALDHVQGDVNLGALDPEERTDTGWQLTSVDGADGDSAPTLSRPSPAGATTLPGWSAGTPPRGGPPPVPAGSQRQAATPTGPVPAPVGPPPPIFTAPSPALAPMLAADASQSASDHAQEHGHDPFQPPDAASNASLELDDKPTRVLAMAPRPPPSRSEPQGVIAGATFRRPSLAASVGDNLADSPRARFAAGLALAFIVGLLPAIGFAWSRSDSAYDDIRAQLQADYAAADTPERWSTLRGVRDDALVLAHARQRRLAISGCLIWLAAAGAVAFVWFRVIDWPRGPEHA